MTAINWQEVITALGGNTAALAIAAWLIKALISKRLETDVERFKIEAKAGADAEIERVKSFLIRASRVHERQLDTLTKLYRHFFEASGHFNS